MTSQPNIPKDCRSCLKETQTIPSASRTESASSILLFDQCVLKSKTCLERLWHDWGPRGHVDTEPPVAGHPFHFGRGRPDVYLSRAVARNGSLRRGTAHQTRCGRAEQPSALRVNTSSPSNRLIIVAAQKNKKRAKHVPHSMSCTVAYCEMSKCPTNCSCTIRRCPVKNYELLKQTFHRAHHRATFDELHCGML